MWLNIYCVHPNCKTPNDNVMIWRYVKDEVTVESQIDVIPNMLEKQCLHFTRADIFPDTWEGAPSTEHLPTYDLLNKYREKSAINCWNINDFESYLMWNTYIGKGNGIVIQSSIGKLRSSFEKSVGNDEYIGKINYIKSFGELPIETNRFEAVLRKRCHYKEEAEVRVVTAKQNDGVFDENGVDIPVPIDNLIEKIYISPESDDSFKNKIEELLKKHKLDIEVLTSELSKKRPYIKSKDIPKYKVCTKPWTTGDVSANLIPINETTLSYTKLKEK